MPRKQILYLEVIYPEIDPRNTRAMKMEEIYAIRLERFRQVLEHDYKGKQAALAEAVGKPANYVSRILGGTKKLGEEIVREFEDSLGKPAYWFDGRDIADGWPFATVDQKRFDALTPEQRRGIEQSMARQVDAFTIEEPPKGNGAKAA